VNLEEIQSLGALVIRPDAPCGDPVRDEPEFERLQTEVRKLELPDGIQPDWAMVSELCAGILRGKSKDLLPACFLSYALFRLHGYEGLACGLQLLLDMVDQHWEGLYPDVKRVRGRLSAIEWFAHRTALEAGARDPDPAVLAALESSREKVGRLGETLERKAEGGWTLLGELRSALEEASNRTPEASMPVSAPDPGPDSSVAAASPVSAAPSGGAPAASGLSGSITTENDAAQTLEAIRSAAFRLADYLRTADPKNPLGYRLPRISAWLTLRELPPATDGVTRIPAPPPDLGQRVREASDRGQWLGVLEQTEGRIAGAVLWLDLHRYAWQALDALGPDFAAAAAAVADETAGLLRRLPGVEGLNFTSGTPFADEATRTWIRERVAPAAAEGGAGTASGLASTASPGDSSEAKEIDDARAEARAFLRQKKLREALQVLQDGAARSRSMRGRMRWGLEIGRICQEARSPETAYLHLRGLYEEVSRAGLEEWDPAGAVELTKVLLLSLDEVLSSGHPGLDDERAFHRELMKRLCRLDIASALASEGRR
jgi:type VI secretion system protein VasJ